MVMCIWNTPVKDRHCEYCSYRGGCEKYDKLDTRTPKEKYVDSMSDIVGMDILQKSRLSKLVWARYMVAYQMRQDGYSVLSVGRMLGLDHSSVTHCMGRMRMMLDNPRLYDWETRIWMKFQKTLTL